MEIASVDLVCAVEAHEVVAVAGVVLVLTVAVVVVHWVVVVWLKLQRPRSTLCPFPLREI